MLTELLENRDNAYNAYQSSGCITALGKYKRTVRMLTEYLDNNDTIMYDDVIDVLATDASVLTHNNKEVLDISDVDDTIQVVDELFTNIKY